MKRLLLLLVLALAAMATIGQVPAGFTYQAVVRSNAGEVIANQAVRFRFSILQNSTIGTPVYVETQSVTTNLFGLANAVVGAGNVVSGTFDPASWGNHSHFFKVELDPTNGTSFAHMGTTQLMAVPYAFHAQTVEILADNQVVTANILDGTIITADLADNAVTNAKIINTAVSTDKLANHAVTAPKLASMGATSGQVMKWDGSTWVAGNDNTGGTPTGAAGGDLTGSYPNPTIANGTITSAKVVDGAIGTADLANGSVTAAKISTSGGAANKVLTYKSTGVTWDYAPGAIIKWTLLSANCSSTASANTTYRKISDIGTFTKADADSKVEVTFNGRIFVQTFSSSSGAYFEIRIDNLATTNGRAKANVRLAEAGGTGVPVSLSGVFTGLGTGTHTVSMWVATANGTATTILFNPGCWDSDHVIVKEVK